MVFFQRHYVANLGLMFLKVGFRKLVLVFLAPGLVFGVHLVLLWFNVYYNYGRVDILMHFAGGAAIAISAILLLREVVFRKVLAAVLAAALLWELAELIVDLNLGFNHQLGLADASGDVLMGLLGGLFVWFMFSKDIITFDFVASVDKPAISADKKLRQ
jgi:hypothetical protein